MAAALAIDVPTVLHSSARPLDDHSPATMATVGDSYAKSSSPRPIPSPVTIPPRFDDNDNDHVALDMDGSSHPVGSSLSPQASPRFVKHPPPLPIPDFVFPARPSNPTSNSAPSSYSRATGRRPKSVADLQDRGTLSPISAAFPGGGNFGHANRSPALPDFVFNPSVGAATSPTPSHAFLSPPQSPQSARAIPIRPGGGGHRRGGSEFVGGSLRSGEPFAFLSTSPTKSESGLASPRLSPLNSPSAPPVPGVGVGVGVGAGVSTGPGPGATKTSGPPGGRRGHAHRRSAAISIHDISSMMQPTKPSPAGITIQSSGRGSSAPSSPKGLVPKDKIDYTFPERSATDPDLQSYVTPDVSTGRIPDLQRTTVATANAQSNNDVPAQDVLSSEPLIEETSQRFSMKPAQRTRVGFSDTLEFIPRPLSVVSSDSASTVTARPPTSGNHSVSGSISSIISLNASIAASIDREAISPLARSPSRSTMNDSRPSTAGAILDRTQSITMEDIVDGVSSPRRRNSIPILSTMPNPDSPTEYPPASALALPSPNKTPKRWSFFGLDPFIGGNTSSHSSPTRPSCSSSPVSVGGAFPASPGMDSAKAVSIGSPPKQSLEQFGAEAGSFEDVVDGSNELALTKTVSRKPSTKKKKKVKSWGILSRKSKPRRKSRRAPTPPPIVLAAESDDDSFEAAPLDSQPSDAAAHTPGPDDLPSLEAGDFAAPPPMVFVTPSGSPSEPRDSPSTWQPLPSPSFSVPDEDTSLAMIDLDAALGPFNTPLPLNHEWEAAQSAGGLSKRQLHSAAGMSRFSGPGMHYSHRRAESAPEMPPFNRAGLPRFSSTTAMADVFEEDEEDDDDDVKTKGSSSVTPTPGAATVNPPYSASLQCTSKPSSLRSASSSSSMPPRRSSDCLQERSSNIDIRVTSSDGGAGFSSYDRSSAPIEFSAAFNDDATSSIALSRRGSNLSGLSDDDKTQPSMCLKSEYSASSLHDDVIVEEEDRYTTNNGINNSFSFDDDSCEFAMESSSDSTIHSPGRLMKGKGLAPVDVSPMHLPTTSSASLAAPVSPYSMAPTSSSAFPSSPRSPMSYDANRISLATAPSSITEENNFQSLLLGEPGPEVRISSDIPSLTSSNSTMTRESAPLQLSQMPFQGPPFMPAMPGPQPRAYLPSRGMERPASFTSTAFGRRRSSLASLHRLISTSHGERSKLSIEVQLDTASTASGDPEKHKSSRTKRLSRMMQFWRGSKEDA
ncbi:cell wall proline rich protein [Ophiostoma piceae UAMH 11346]|uniref:Cell wall proline rich protein n=1 Tax=Ophiostoma piceae (strain UAMH 11346) TaxID=1262450 RepID=S3C3F4_OPHP1|nr:cell wall proline rich protein [Ophiostoma piceae UAMH 11346]